MKRQGFVPIIVIILVAVALAVGGGAWWHGKKNSGPQPSAPPDALTATSTQDVIAHWNIYRNEKYKLEFKYPAEWGAIVMEPGTSNCPSKYDVPLQLHKNDARLTFSKFSGAEIRLLEIDSQNPIIHICPGSDFSYDTNLVEERNEFDKLVLGNHQYGAYVEYGVFQNLDGIKMSYFPDLWNGEFSIFQLYKFFGNSLEVEAAMAYQLQYRSPESEEFDKMKISEKQYFSMKDWLQKGNAQYTNSIRKNFEDFDIVMQNFKFIK